MPLDSADARSKRLHYEFDRYCEKRDKQREATRKSEISKLEQIPVRDGESQIEGD